MMMLDTTFLIDLQREWVRGEPGAATRFLENHEAEEFTVSVVAVVEFLEGYDVASDGERFLESFEWIDVTPSIARTASRVRRRLRREGAMIGDFDILIGATAVGVGAPLATANSDHFGAIEGLALVAYR